MGGTTAFEDRVLTLDGTPDQLAAVGGLLGARTRLAVLGALMRSNEPLNINEVARRVGVDASPVRTHLELLAKAGLAEELPAGPGRERRFTTRLKNVRLALEGVYRRAVPEKGAPSKEAARLAKKLAAVQKEIEKLEGKARVLSKKLDDAWAKGQR